MIDLGESKKVTAVLKLFLFLFYYAHRSGSGSKIKKNVQDVWSLLKRRYTCPYLPP